MSELEHAIEEFEFSSELEVRAFLLGMKTARETPLIGMHDHERVFYQKRTNDEIEFYSIYEQRELGDLIYRVLMVEVDMERSMLNKGKADLALNFNLVV